MSERLSLYEFSSLTGAGNITNSGLFFTRMVCQSKASRGLTDGMTTSEEWSATILDQSSKLNAAVNRWQFSSDSRQLNQ